MNRAPSPRPLPLRGGEGARRAGEGARFKVLMRDFGIVEA